MNAAAEALGRCHFMQFCNGYDIMKQIRMTEVPWMIMVMENDCEHCDRVPNCTYKDLVLCFMSKTDKIVEFKKK